MSNSYLLYQLYEKRGDQPFHPAYPVRYSVDGDGTMQKILKMEDDPNCNSVDNTIYQWVEVAGEYECSGTTKCQKEKEQRSDDFGVTWTDTGEVRPGTPIEYNSEYCGWQPPQYRTVSGEPYCNECIRMVDIWNEVSYDGGVNWEPTGISGSTVLEYNSFECCEPIFRWIDSEIYLCVEEEYGNQYLTFDIISGGTIVFYSNDRNKTISYSTDDGNTWVQITSSYSGTSFNVNAGDKILFKGNNSTYARNANSYCSFSGSTAYFNIYGNIMSLISGDTFQSVLTLEEPFTFVHMFESTNVVNASHLVLPANNITPSCYYSMFRGCTSLTDAPFILPATVLPEEPNDAYHWGCYGWMFYGCTSLTSAPILPATILSYRSYANMFYGCTSLTTAPELPATELGNYCYQGMFQGCTSLTDAPVELPATTLANACYNSMFQGCTSLTTAPELPATTLVSGCYNSMFYSCGNLNYIKCLATDISASNALLTWVSSVSPTGTFVKAAGFNGWSRGYNGIPNNWTVQDAS